MSASLPNRTGQRGYVLIVFLMLTALLVAGAYRILPKMVFEGQREKEEELIFRGQQYRRAIQLFVRKFGRYPTSLDELENTNDFRFLRKRYTDPITGGEFRLIHVAGSAAGPVFPDSLVLNSSTAVATAPGGTGSGFGNSETSRNAGGNPGASLSGVPGTAAAAPSSSQASQTEGGGFSFGQNSGPSGSFGLSPSDAEKMAQSPTATGGANAGQQPRGGASSGGSGAGAGAQPNPQPVTFGGGGIAGVASQSDKKAIKILAGQTQYDHWEFIYDYRTDRLGTAAVLRASGQAGSGQGRQGQGGQGQGGQQGPAGQGPGPQSQGLNPPGFPGQIPGARGNNPFGLGNSGAVGPTGGMNPAFPTVPQPVQRR